MALKMFKRGLDRHGKMGQELNLSHGVKKRLSLIYTNMRIKVSSQSRWGEVRKLVWRVKNKSLIQLDWFAVG